MQTPLLSAWLALSLSAGVFAQASVSTSTKSVVAAAAAYVESYNAKMQYVLADELATQRVTFAGPVHDQKRTTKADVFITFLPAESVWIAARDVREVDGTAVNDENNIRAMMARAPLSRLGAVIAQKNAQFNIGSISRTFNEPTLALLIMTDKHRGRFKFDGKRAPGDTRVTLSFKEQGRPTLIVGTNGAPVYTTGALVVDPATGRIESTRLELTMGTVTAKIETTYAEDAKLNFWVPSLMRETYLQTARGFEEEIDVESRYSNYRKFDTSVIIK
jgi:hypothetical protein